LAEVRAYQQKLDELRKEADQRLRAEQERLSHAEEHTRRLEHELARLSIASEQLKAAEANQSVDQEQAERELARLQQLIADTEADIDELREQPQGKKSYAIVPYKGANGTYRKPIYIECSAAGITLHPEGIQLTRRDFADPFWSGNPLAAAVRATRHHVNKQAALAGAPEPPDPYPMILVRPDGIQQYRMARAAITSWDADFGYEFIDQDWQLTFPEAADPQLAQAQQHAIMLAREELERNIRAAPRKYRGFAAAGTRGSGTGRSSSGGGYAANGYGDGSNDDWGGDANGAEAAGDSQFAASQSGGSGAGSGGAGDANDGQCNTGGDSTQFGEYAETTGEPASAGGTGTEPGTRSDSTNAAGDRYAQSTPGTNTPGGESSSADGSATQTASTNSAGGASPGGSPSQGGSAGSGSPSANNASIADSQGRNWAVDGGRQGSVPIQRPIQVVVRKNRLTLLPSRHATGGGNATGREIALDQPMARISEEFVTALRTHIEDWGIAGRGLYWKPVLRLNVSPDAAQTADQVVRLLENSGVEVALPQTARAATGEPNHAPR